jgi:hypothetical protein
LLPSASSVVVLVSHHKANQMRNIQINDSVLLAFVVVLLIPMNQAFCGFLVFRESFETPVVDLFENTNGYYLNFGVTPGQTGATGSRGLSFVGDSGLTWHIDSGNVDITDETGWAAADGKQSLDLNGWVAGSLYVDLPLSFGSHLLTFALASHPLKPLGKMSVSFDNKQIGLLDATSHVPGYNSHTLSFSVQNASVYRLKFASLSPENEWGGPVIDNIHLESQAVPEPNLTTVCLLAGCASLARLQRRASVLKSTG